MNKREEKLGGVVEDKVNQYMDEQKERERRSCNLILHNIPESTSDDPEERKQHDSSKVEEVLDYLDIASSQENEALKPIRLGRKTDGDKPRLMRVTVESTVIKKDVLSKARSLRNSRDENLSKVFISPDLTPKEREVNKKLRDELRTRRNNGDNVMIRNGKIVEARSSFRREGIEFSSLQGATAGTGSS